MKLTKQQLREMIREEVSRTMLNEEVSGEEELMRLLKSGKDLTSYPIIKRMTYLFTFIAMIVEDESDYKRVLRELRSDAAREEIFARKEER